MKKPKFTMKDFEQVICIIAVLLGVAGAIYSMALFYSGYHNTDLSYNVCLISNDLDLDYRGLEDNYEVGKNITMTDLFITGRNQMQSSIYFSLLSAFMIGYFFVLLLVQRGKK